MTFDKCLQAMDECAVMIRAFLVSGHNAHQAKDLAHCLGMVERAKAFGPERKEKAMRWLGFIQGVMFAHGVADVDVIKDMNRSREEPAVCPVCGSPWEGSCTSKLYCPKKEYA